MTTKEAIAQLEETNHDVVLVRVNGAVRIGPLLPSAASMHPTELLSRILLALHNDD